MGGPAVARSVGRRLTALGPGAEALARAVAILGTNVEPRHAHALAGLDDPAGSVAADALAAAGVLGPGRPLDFVHPLVRAAAAERVPPAERALSHLAAARMLDTEGADAERTAPHLLACDRRADPWVVDVLRRAASRSVRRGAPDAAVRYLTRALEEPPAPEDRPRVLAELGKAEVRAALPDDAVAHLREALAATPDSAERAMMTQDLAIGLVAPGRYGRDARGRRRGGARGRPGAEPAARGRAAVRGQASPPHASRGRGRSTTGCRATWRGDTPGERMVLGTLAPRAADAGRACRRGRHVGATRAGRRAARRADRRLRDRHGRRLRARLRGRLRAR